MRTITYTHACPIIINGEPCEATVALEYESGRAREDFIPTHDDAQCEQGHVMPEVVLIMWYEADACEHEQRMQEQGEMQEYYHRSGGL